MPSRARLVDLAIFEGGADALQSDLPDEVALALGRTVPPPRSRVERAAT